MACSHFVANHRKVFGVFVLLPKGQQPTTHQQRVFLNPLFGAPLATALCFGWPTRRREHLALETVRPIAGMAEGAPGRRVRHKYV